MKKLSIVVPVYFNEPNLNDTVPRLIDLGKNLSDLALELVFVDDGSGDRSLELLLSYQKKYPATIRVVALTRNFGGMVAVQAGMRHATGDCIAVVSADLQDPIERIADMVAHWRQGAKAVYAVRTQRVDPAATKFFAGMFYRIFRKWVFPDFPIGGFDFYLVDRQIVDLINRIEEKNLNLMALIFWLGFKPVLMPYARVERRAGKSRWTFRKRLKLLIDSFIGFSYVPIRFLSVTGIVLSTTAIVCALLMLLSHLACGTAVRGWAVLTVVIIFFSGMQSFMIGIVGEHVWRALDETRKRPAFIVDRVYEEELE